MSIQSKPSTAAYSEGWDRIFGKKPAPVEVKLPKPVEIVIAADEVVVNLQIERDRLTAEWWKFCEQNQMRLKHIPQFEQWRAGGPYDWTDEGNTPD